MESLKQKSFSLPNIVTCIKILQYPTRILGMGCDANRFEFNYDSVVFTMMVIWFGGCYLGRELCIAGCNTGITYKNIVILLSGIRLIQLGMLACIIKFRCSNEVLKQIHLLSNLLGEKNTEFLRVSSTKFRH